PLLVHWNGTSWTQPAGLVNPDNDSRLNDVDASATGNVWAVGYWFDNAANGGQGGTRALAVRWNGSAFTSYTPPTATTGNIFEGVSTRGASDVWAAGSDDDGMLVEHWNGTSWSISLSGVVGHLYDVYEVSPTNVWAVGMDELGHAVVE